MLKDVTWVFTTGQRCAFLFNFAITFRSGGGVRI